jgi:co-chaperonin GroES (HSP10)
LVQLKRIKRTTASGIILNQETRDFEKYNTQIAKVVALGPLAYKDRQTMQPWPEGTWAEVGDFVRVPKYGGDRFEVAVPNEPEEPIVFMLINDVEISSAIVGDPLSFDHYINK